MPRLLRDRYFEYAPDRAWDLVTGDDVNLGKAGEGALVRDPALQPLAEVFDHGRDGVPRWIVADGGRASTLRAIADEARARGFVPIAADLYLRLIVLLADDLRERALCLIVRPSVPLDVARTALIDAASRSPRPHVLLTFTAPESLAAAAPTGTGWRAREARAAYGVQPLAPNAPAALPPDVRQHVLRGHRATEFARSGRHAAAERLLRDVAGALERRRASAAAADAMLALGQLLLERGRAAHAEESFGQAAQLAGTARTETLADRARIWQAAARTDLAQLTSAESLCRAVLLAGTIDGSERRRAEATLARVLLWQGRGDEAAGLEFVNAGDPDDAPFVHATAVRVLLDRGQTFAAGQRARALLTATESASDPQVRVIAAAAHLRVLLATGDLGLVEVYLRALRAATREARTPLRLVRIRLLWVDALRQAGQEAHASRELRRLERVRAAAPPLLRREIDRRLRGDGRVAPLSARRSVATPATAAQLVRIVQREDDDRAALTRLLALAAESLNGSRIDLWSADAGPATAVLSSGAGLPTRLGPRVLEAGIVIGPEAGEAGSELGVPVRFGSKLAAAIVARWPVDVLPPPHAIETLELAAAVAAPRVDSLLAAGREAAAAATAVPELVGISAAIAEVRRAAARAAAAPFAVLIEGESGVGKELVARAIHQLSARRERRFCDVNCAALPDDLFEAELFGYARGAFTGAVADRAGLVEEADGGTLFLDEVADLSPRAQAKLLRAVQQQEIRRVGETFSRKVDVRVVSAANRDLRVEAAAGRFRQDLLYRLDVIRIRIPPLRERPEDIPLLVQHFWKSAAARVGTTATLTHAVITALSRYHWPGNVRELQNAIAALAVEAPARGHVRPGLLPAVVTGAAAVQAGRLAEARAQFERRFVEVALARAGGSRSRAARELGLSRQGLLKVLTRLGMT